MFTVKLSFTCSIDNMHMIRSIHYEHLRRTYVLKTYSYKQGPVVQSIVSLTGSIVVKMLRVPVNTQSYSQVFLLKNANAKTTHIFFSKNISVYAIFNGQIFNDMLTNDIVSFEQLGPDPHQPSHLSFMVVALCDCTLHYLFIVMQTKKALSRLR